MAAGERPTARSKEMWMNCMKVKNGIMAACQQGALTPEEYSASLEAQVQKDKSMIKYFMALGDQKKAKIVQERLKMIEEELKGM